MASIIRVPAADFSHERLDTGFYSEEYFTAKRKIEQAGLITEAIGKICEPWQFGAYALCNEIVWADKEEGVPFIKAEAIESPLIDEDRLSYVSKDTHELLYKSALKAGDIIVSTSGTVGRLAVLPDSIPNANSNQDTIKFSLKNTGYDSHFVAAWLTTDFAQSYMRREAGGAVQQHIYLYNFTRLPLLKIAEDAQQYIGDKVRQAERLRAWGKGLNRAIESHFDCLAQNPPPAQTYWRVPSQVVEAYRINPKQYDPVVVGLLNRAESQGVILNSLGSVFGPRGISGGATPKGAGYQEDGVLFARVQNVKPLRLDLSDAVFIDSETDDELARSRCEADEIILTITGYPGTASLVTEQDLPVNINQHSVRFDVVPGISPAYICAALNSRFLKYQVDRFAIGGTRDALDYPSVRRLMIPRLSQEAEENIDIAVRNFITSQKLAQTLTTAAKLLVEALIENRVTEAQLIAAQQALDAGDTDPDRALLGRLRTDGLDGQGPPLFADLDRLYTLLEQAETAADRTPSP